MPCRDLRCSLALTSLTYRMHIDKGHQEAPTEKTHRRPMNLLRNLEGAGGEGGGRGDRDGEHM